MPESSIRSKNLKLINTSGTPINPATEDKQDDQITLETSIDNKLESTTDGTQIKLRTTDDETQDTLIKILKELKIMNIHLSLITNTDVTKEEI